MAAEKLPSQAGRKALLQLHAGRQIAPFGNLQNTLASLRNRGLINHREELTEAGHEMVKRLTVKPEVMRHVA